MTKTFSGAVYSSVRLALIATMFLGPIAGLAAMNTAKPAAAGAPTSPPGNWHEVLLVFLRLGLTSFR